MNAQFAGIFPEKWPCVRNLITLLWLLAGLAANSMYIASFRRLFVPKFLREVPKMSPSRYFLLRSLLFPLVYLAMVTGGSADYARGQNKAPSFRVLALAEHGGIHQPFVDAAKIWLGKLAEENNFTVDYMEDTQKIDDHLLAKYNLFIQLNYPPYNWTETAKTAFVNYIEKGKGGWIGFHHATLLGEFDGTQIWPWFRDFMGGIRFKNYIATFVTGTVTIEDKDHPAMKGVKSPFVIEDEEFYTYDKSPRPNVHVLASVDENTYTPSTDIKMGDHPVIWTNDRMKARNIYIFMGHRPELFQNPAFTQIVKNSIFWAANK
jgi:type 1 glutamine amidotransferase